MVRVENSQEWEEPEPLHRRGHSGQFSTLTPTLSRTGEGGASRTVARGPPQRTDAMPSLVVTVPTFWRRSASPSVFNSSRSSTVWLRSRVPSAVAIGETM